MAATFTTRLALRKPDPDPSTGDFVNVATDISASMDKIDASIGAISCTSGARPAGPFVGQFARETDTGNLIICTATPSTWARVFNSGQSAWTGTINHTNATVGVETVNTRISGDTQPRYVRTSDGFMAWGPGGAAATDTTLYRSAVDTLKTDDSLVVAGNLTVSGVTGGIGGPWVTWAPTWTNLTVGNGTLWARYRQVGKTINYRLKFILGSTSAMNASAPTWTMPVTPHASYIADDMIGQGQGIDASISTYVIAVQYNGSGISRFNISNTVPFAFGTGDWFASTGTYEAA